MVKQRKTGRDWAGRFIGPRVNCENVPLFTSRALAWMLDDPRKVPYLMIWMDQNSEKIIEAVRIALSPDMEEEIPWAKCVEITKELMACRIGFLRSSDLFRGTGERPDWSSVRTANIHDVRSTLGGWIRAGAMQPSYSRSWQCRSCANCATPRKEVRFCIGHERLSAKCWLPSRISRDMTVLSRFTRTYLRTPPTLRRDRLG